MNRRQMLFGSVFATALMPFAAQARRFGGVGAGSGFPLVAPSGEWTGVFSTGPTPPVDPTRIHAKPVLQWWQSSQIRGVGPTLVGVIADANGGIDYVDMWVEGTTQPVTATYYPDTDVNGNARLRPFWGINVDCAAAYAAHPTGAIRVYAKAYPNATIGPMEPRVIGPLIIYPRATAYDWDKTVNPSGGADYTTLAAAMQAMKDALTTGGKECGRVTIKQTGTYDMGSPDVYQFPWSYGMSCITADSGVTATIVRGTGAFDPFQGGYPQGSWDPRNPWAMYTYIDNIEFRGAGIVIDRKNFAHIATSPYQNTNPLNLNPVDGSQNKSGNYLFNGCKITNSAGAWPQTYWCGGPAPTLLIADMNADQCTVWSQGCTVEYQFGAAICFQNVGEKSSGAIFNKVRKACGSGHFMPNFVYGEYYTDSTQQTELDYNQTVKNGMSIIYSGANATQATAQVVYDDAGKNLLLQAPAGTTLATLNVRDPQGGLWPQVTDNSYFIKFSELVTYINAHNGSGGACQGFQATLIDDTIPAVQMSGHYGPSGTTQNVKGVSYTLLANYGLHTEWLVWHVGPVENALVWNCTVFNAGWGTNWINWGGGVGHFKDISFKNNTYDHGPSPYNPGNAGSTSGSHAVMDGVTMSNPLLVGQGFDTDGYSYIRRIVAMDIGSWNGTWADNIPQDCVVGGADAGPGSGMVLVPGTDLGNAWTYAEFSSRFVSNSTEDWTPKAGGVLVTNLFTRGSPDANPRDAQMAVRAPSDAAGAWKIGGTAPVWPF